MHMDVWYDLAIRELSGPNEPARELLKDAAAVQRPRVLDEESEQEQDAG